MRLDRRANRSTSRASCTARTTSKPSGAAPCRAGSRLWRGGPAWRGDTATREDIPILRSSILTGALVAPAPVVPFADISNVTVEYYDIASRDGSAIRRSIDSLPPLDPNDGKRVDALTGWDVRWRWSRDAAGKCSAQPEDVVFRATVKMPRIADGKVPGKVRERFDRYLRPLLKHEDGHVRSAWRPRGEIVSAINGATCATARAAAQAAVDAIKAGDIAYDRVTRHGSTTVLRFP